MASSVRCLVVLFSLLVLPSVMAQSSPQPTITSVSGCTDVGVTTWNCTGGSTLTVTGTNFIDDPSAYMSSNDAGLQCWISHPIDVVNNNFTCYLESNRPPTWPGNVLERSVIRFVVANVTSAPFYGFAMTHTDMPVLTGVYGCDDSNNANHDFTQNCVPDMTVLTVTGLHFDVINTVPYTSVMVRIGQRITTAFPQLINDTALTVALSTFYSRILIPDHYAGQPIPLFIQLSWYLTNSVNISFTNPIPPPQVVSLSSFSAQSGGCQGRNASGLGLVGCVPGVSSAVISGHYFYQPMQVFVGGQLCMIRAIASTQITCLLPIIPLYVPGQLYDLVLNDSIYWDDNDVGVVPQAISFVGGAVLASALPCAAGCGIAYSAKCQAGQAITIQGVGFTSDPQAVMSLTNPRSGWSGNCTSLVEVDQYTYACTLPQLTTAEAALQPTAMTFILWSNGLVSTPLSVIAYDSATPIIISAITGCNQSIAVASDGSLSIGGCDPYALLTLTGANFFRGTFNAPPGIWSADMNLQMTVPSMTSTSLVAYFRLYQPRLAFDIPITFTARSTTQGCSNTFNITFTGPPPDSPPSSSSTGSLPFPPPSSSSSSGGLSGGGIAGVVIAGIVALVVLLAVFIYLRGGHWGKGGSKGGLTDRSSQYAPHADSDFELQRSATE